MKQQSTSLVSAATWPKKSARNDMIGWARGSIGTSAKRIDIVFSEKWYEH